MSCLQQLCNYLSKFSTVVTNKVVYCTHGEGPLRGLQNGDRAYKVEVNADTNIGTYHAIESTSGTVDSSRHAPDSMRQL